MADIPEGDFRRHMPKFQDDVMAGNMKVTHAVEKVAEKKGVTNAQIAIGWVRSISGRKGRPFVIPIPGASTEQRVVENCKQVDLTEVEMSEMERILKENEVIGARYGGPDAALSEY